MKNKTNMKKEKEILYSINFVIKVFVNMGIGVISGMGFYWLKIVAGANAFEALVSSFFITTLLITLLQWNESNLYNYRRE